MVFLAQANHFWCVLCLNGLIVESTLKQKGHPISIVIGHITQSALIGRCFALPATCFCEIERSHTQVYVLFRCSSQPGFVKSSEITPRRRDFPHGRGFESHVAPRTTQKRIAALCAHHCVFVMMPRPKTYVEFQGVCFAAIRRTKTVALQECPHR